MARRGEEQGHPELRTSSFDVVDLAVGLVLLILVPAVCIAVAGMLGAEVSTSKYDFRGKPKVDPAPDLEEVETRYKCAEAIYTENAQTFIKSLLDHADSMYASRLSEWASKCLRNAESALLSLEQLIQSHPESQSEFRTYLDRIANLRGRIRTDLERVRSVKIVGQDMRR